MQENDNIIILTDDQGNDVEFELLDAVEYEDQEYVLLSETSQEDDDALEAVILRINRGVDEDTFEGIEDEELVQEIFQIFLDRQEEDED